MIPLPRQPATGRRACSSPSRSTARRSAGWRPAATRTVRQRAGTRRRPVWICRVAPAGPSRTGDVGSVARGSSIRLAPALHSRSWRDRPQSACPPELVREGRRMVQLGQGTASSALSAPSPRPGPKAAPADPPGSEARWLAARLAAGPAPRRVPASARLTVRNRCPRPARLPLPMREAAPSPSPRRPLPRPAPGRETASWRQHCPATAALAPHRHCAEGVAARPVVVPSEVASC